MLTKRQREIETSFWTTQNPVRFQISASALQFFEVPPEARPLSLSIAFRPTKPGDYSCHILMLSLYDIRVCATKGVSIPATKEMSLKLVTVVGRPVKQDIPLQNPSSETWQFKVTVTGDQAFSTARHSQEAEHADDVHPVQPDEDGQLQR
jgi:hypothetical protein